MSEGLPDFLPIQIASHVRGASCRRHAVAVQAHPAVGEAAPRPVHAGVLHRAQQERQGHHGCGAAGRAPSQEPPAKAQSLRLLQHAA